MRRLSTSLLILAAFAAKGQDTCILTSPVACLTTCETVTYDGPGSDTATYMWTSTCGTFTNPNAKQPGEHCYLFAGTCVLQVIVQEPGQSPDTCSTEIIVTNNPDAVLQGDTTICAGSCTPLIVQFMSGTSPFAYSIDDGEIVNFYTSNGMTDTVMVCPEFFTTYTLGDLTDAFGCVAQGELNSVDVNVNPGISASITQNGNLLCANPPGQNYQWYDCAYAQLLGNSACFEMPADSCYCVIVSDQATGQCVDTVCGDFVIPCTLVCELTSPDSVCAGEDMIFTYSTNASPGAVFTVDVVTNGEFVPALITTETITLPAGDYTCATVTLFIQDGLCETSCTDDMCTFTYAPSASFGEDVASCASCVSLPVDLSGIPPFTLYISDGIQIDTIENITDSTYYYISCPAPYDTVTYTVLNVTDSISQCAGFIIDTTINVFVYGSPVAGIEQQGNQLCATAEPGATFEWFQCDSLQLLSFDSCLSIVDTGCYCLVVTNGFCTDTICGTFESVECELTCNIELPDTACLEETVVFAYTGNASSTATFNWLIDVPGFPMMPVSGNDTVILSYSEAGCYGVTLQVFDLGCLTICTDTICIITPQSTASICCGIEACDTCTLLEFNFTGIPPWTVYLTDGLNLDTITGITTSPYFHQVCPQLDTTITYSLFRVIDGTNTCPAAIVGDTLITVTLHPSPVATITQNVDTLCATADTLLSYGWYACPSGVYLDTNRCFVPTTSGCYCVDVSTQFDCVDTACYTIILSDVINILTQPIHFYPNPSSNEFFCKTPQAVSWQLYNTMGEIIDRGHWLAGENQYTWPEHIVPGVFLLSAIAPDGKMYTGRILRQ